MSSSNSRQHAEGHDGFGSSSVPDNIDPALFIQWQNHHHHQQQQQQQPTAPMQAHPGQGYPGQQQPDAFMDIDEAFTSTDFDLDASQFIDSSPMMENGTTMPYSENSNATHTSTTYAPDASQLPHGFPQTVQPGRSSTTPVDNGGFVYANGSAASSSSNQATTQNFGSGTTSARPFDPQPYGSANFMYPTPQDTASTALSLPHTQGMQSSPVQYASQHNQDPASLGDAAQLPQGDSNAVETFTIRFHSKEKKKKGKGKGQDLRVFRVIELSKSPEAGDIDKIPEADRGEVAYLKSLTGEDFSASLRKWYDKVSEVYWAKVVKDFEGIIPPDSELLEQVFTNLTKSHPCINDPWTGHCFYKSKFGAKKQIEKLQVWMYGRAADEEAVLPFPTWRETLGAKTDKKDRTVPHISQADVFALLIILKKGDPNVTIDKVDTNRAKKWKLLGRCKLLQGGPYGTDEYWAGFQEELEADPNQKHLFAKVVRELGTAAHVGTTAESHDDAETALVRQLKQQLEDKDVRIQQLEYENAELRRQIRMQG
ncbi:hypothetical protein VM1G_11158 [Cytospora mali]|uniref:Uncharacterized protein n=1 Tax=Cytospora mali TaxID=578113 RepID=A0A194VJM5_CYTMA|nr:hypothetical protein VM1G_11158 [Valsa mali]